MKRADRDEWWERYHDTVNMSAEELRRWSRDPASRLASQDRSPIKRNLHLLRTKKGKWGDKEIAWAKKTVSFVARMRGVNPGRPVHEDLSKRDIALLNWGFDPRKGVYRRNDLLPGGLADQRRPEDFDPDALRRGMAIEMEHTRDPDKAREIAMDHLEEHPLYYEALGPMEKRLSRIEQRMRPNRSRRRVYDAYDIAKDMRETFADRPVERIESHDFDWPVAMQNVGDSLSVAYASDKWQPKDARGRREVELYKHLAESRNQALAAPGVLFDHDDPNEPWPVRGPMVRLSDVPMPRHFAVLGLFEEINLMLYGAGSDKRPRFRSNPDDDIVHVRVRHAYLGGSKILWSREDQGAEDEPFIFVYTKEAGVMFVVTGDELDIERDGIVG